MTAPKGAMISPGNDDRHNRVDANRGGSPLGKDGRASFASDKKVPIASRGGFGHQGRDRVAVRAGMSGARGASGNPASRGGFSGQARGGAFKPEARISGHGGSPQHRGGAGSGTGFGTPGQTGVPGGNPTQPRPGAGNTGGLAAKRVIGRFKRQAMGAQPTGGESAGKYGAPPVTANT
jgi:hypothetical protein